MNQHFNFYSVLTDPVKGYDYMTSLLVDHGVPFVQLRMKDAPRDVVLATALRMRKITNGTDTRLIINDDPCISREVDADGVHVGQDDMPYHEVRKIIGKDKILGLSTHNARQAECACTLSPPPDYIGVGPVFPTPTKKISDPPLGISGMKEMLAIAEASRVPAVCIGGIDLTNLPSVLEAGAKNICMVRQLTQADDPDEVLKHIAKYFTS